MGLTNLHVLRILYCSVQLRYLPANEHGYPKYHIPGYLKKFGPPEWDDFNARDIRMMARDQIRLDQCVFCENPIAIRSIGDHLIPVSKGGKETPDNWIALCRSHNSSKGAKDFIEWWHGFLGCRLEWCPADILCMYSRLKYRFCMQDGTLALVAPKYLIDAVQEALSSFQYKDTQAILRSVGIKGEI